MASKSLGIPESLLKNNRTQVALFIGQMIDSCDIENFSNAKFSAAIATKGRVSGGVIMTPSRADKISKYRNLHGLKSINMAVIGMMSAQLPDVSLADESIIPFWRIMQRMCIKTHPKFNKSVMS